MWRDRRFRSSALLLLIWNGWHTLTGKNAGARYQLGLRIYHPMHVTDTNGRSQDEMDRDRSLRRYSGV